MDLDRQSLSSIDRNASERGQSQFSNPTDDSWKGAPYASKAFYVLGVFPCIHFNWPTHSCDSDIGKHRSANRILPPCSSSLLCHGVPGSIKPLSSHFIHMPANTCTYTFTHVPAHMCPPLLLTSYRTVCAVLPLHLMPHSLSVHSFHILSYCCLLP